MDKDRRLWNAADEGDLGTVTQLCADSSLNLNWNHEQHERTPFWRACFSGSLTVVEFLLKLDRVDVNLPNYNGSTPFLIACQEHNLDVVRALLRSDRVDPNRPDVAGATAFFVACQEGHLDIIEILLRAPAVDVNLAKETGATPFFIACQKGRVETVSLLLADPRVDINKENLIGASPLWISVPNSQLKVMQLILASRRELRAKTRTIPGPESHNNKSPQEQARAMGFTAIADLLQDYERNPDKTAKDLRKDLGLEDETWLEKVFGRPLSSSCHCLPADAKDPKAVTSLTLGDCGLEELPPQLAQFAGVKELVLCRNPFKPVVAEALVEKIREHRSLQLLEYVLLYFSLFFVILFLLLLFIIYDLLFSSFLHFLFLGCAAFVSPSCPWRACKRCWWPWCGTLRRGSLT